VDIEAEIEAWLAGQSAPKQADLRALHARIMAMMPGCRLWFLDGRDESGRIVSNPSIGHGERTIAYADGTTKPFYRIGLSANTSGLSIYIFGIEDRTYLPRTYGERIGKAKVSGYCVKFRRLADVDAGVLDEAMREGIAAPG
jgi:hypothetical protein